MRYILELILVYILCSTIWTFAFYFQVLKWEGEGVSRANANWKQYLVLILGLVSDFIYNITTGTILFLQFPTTILFTTRLHMNQQKSGWRKSFAAWFCKEILNPTSQKYLKKDHC